MAATTLWLAATLSSSGCLLQKKHRAYVPPPEARPAAPVALKDPPLILDPVPQVETASIELPAAEPSSPAPFPAPPKPLPRPPKPVAVSPKPTVPVAETPAPAPLPQITQILPQQQQRELNLQFDEYLNFVTDALTKAGKKTLTGEQQNDVEKIKGFQKQAVQAHEQDLVTAVSYAKRAEVLAKDLLGRLP